MKEYSLIFHAKGPKPSDLGLYLAKYETYDEWYRVGLVQSIDFEVSVHDPLPKFSANTLLGLNIKDCDEPSFDEGLVILCDHFITSNPRNPLGSVIVLNCNYDRTGMAESPWSKFGVALGGVQKISVHANVKDELTNINLVGFTSTKFELENNFDKLPDWINTSYIDYDKLNEVGTDGAVDSLDGII